MRSPHKNSREFFPTKDMQKPSPPCPFRSTPIFMKDAYSAESNEKSIFQFLFFELWLIVFTIYGWHTWISTHHKKKSFKSGQIYRKDVQWAETIEKSIFRFYFFNYGWFCTQNLSKNWSILCTRTTISQKLKIAKLIFICFSIFQSWFPLIWDIIFFRTFYIN